MKGTYLRLLQFLSPYRKIFILALLAMTLYGATDGAVPLIIKMVLDDVFGRGDASTLYAFPVLIIVFALIRGVFGFFQHYLAASVGLSIIRDLRAKLHHKLLLLPFSFYSKEPAGALISRMTNDTLLVRSALTDAAAAVLRDSIRVIALLSVALYLDPWLALLSFIGLPLCLLPMIKFGKRVKRLSKVGQETLGSLTSILQESVSGYRVIQAFVLSKHQQGKFKKENDSFTNTFCRAEKYGALTAPTNEVIASFAIAAVVFYGGVSVLNGSKTQGDFMAFLTAMFLLYEPVKKLSRVNNTVQIGISAAERLFEILDRPLEIEDAKDAIALPPGPGEVKFEKVSFSYSERNGEDSDGEQQGTLKDVSFTIEPGKTVALVGHSGGGKSTIARLLPRFYEANSGIISVDGHNVRSLKLESLREKVAYVDQHPFLFNDTIFENIRIGNLEASNARIEAAAKAAHALDFIQRLPQGFQTMVGEQGFSLSGGERARVAIARALLRDAPILVLDEATAALDNESEKIVQVAIERLMEGRSTLVIAHRLSTIVHADKILVVRSGEIVEQGTHLELLNQGGEYSSLYRLHRGNENGTELIERPARIGER